MADDRTREVPATPPRRPYTTPRLVEYGTVESLTAGTATSGKDGAAGGFKNPA